MLFQYTQNPYRQMTNTKTNETKIKIFPSSRKIRVSHFLKGVGSTMDLSGTTFYKKKGISTPISDAKKLRKDWEIISKDMQNAMNLF